MKDFLNRPVNFPHFWQFLLYLLVLELLIFSLVPQGYLWTLL